MAHSLSPGEAPVGLNEVRAWLRLGATIDDAVLAGLLRAATGICEAFIGQWLIVREVEEIVPLDGGAIRLGVRPVVAVDTVALLTGDGGEVGPGAAEYRTAIARDGTATITIEDRDEAVRARIAYRAGMAAEANDIPEAIRQGILRMTQHLHDARDSGGAAPPAAIAALWQPWRRLTLGGER